MKKKNQIGKLSLSKKTIGNLSALQGGRPPASRHCQVADPQPITIETICWTQSRDIGSECWCSSDDSFNC